MAKGKYAARAANRLAEIDSELLRKCIGERDSLKSELAEALAALEVERSRRAAAVQSRAEELSRELVAQSKADAEASANRRDELGEMAAEWITDLLIHILRGNPGLACIPNDFQDFISLMVGGPRAGEYLSKLMTPYDETFSRRGVRRLSSKNMRQRAEFVKQRKSGNLVGVSRSRQAPKDGGRG